MLDGLKDKVKRLLLIRELSNIYEGWTVLLFFTGRVDKLNEELSQYKAEADFGDYLVPVDSILKPSVANNALRALDDYVVERSGARMGSLYDGMLDECLEDIDQKYASAKSRLQKDGKSVAPSPTGEKASTSFRAQERREKAKTRPATASTHEITPLAPQEPETPPAPSSYFKVKASTASVFDTLFTKSESRGSVSWTDFVAAMAEVGFSVTPKGGSIFTFNPPRAMVADPITLHRPHASDIEGWKLLWIARRLRKKYGWSAETFKVLNADFRDIASPPAIIITVPREIAEHSRTQPPLRLPPEEQVPNIKRSPQPKSPQGQPSQINSLALSPNNLDTYISWDMNDAPPSYDEVVENASKSENADKPRSNVGDASTPYLSYRLVSRSAPSRRWMSLVLNDESIYRILAPRMTLDQRPEVHLTDLNNNKRVATAQVRRSTTAREVRFRLEASSLGSDNWHVALVRGFSEWCCEFTHAGRQYSWVRTHKDELGASKLTSRCFKLVHGDYVLQKSKRKGKGNAKAEDSTDDPAYQQVLMTYIHSPWFDLHAHEAGEIRIYRHENLVIDKEFEYVGLITALGLQQREREARAQALREMANTSM
ncbi:hypothetical protein KC357_g9170 [Hortaea werneckii]|nr:hypothetical protein KC357_g9170 [Hortaea werneckii]